MRDLLEKPLNLAMILSQRSSQENTPSTVMTKDFARTVSLPPAKAMAASKLMMNCRGSILPSNLGKVIGL